MSRILKTALVALTLSFGAPAALASPSVAVASVEVDYSDLDLDREAGARTLLARIERAAGRVCGKRPTSVRFGAMERHTACRMSAIETAVRDVEQPVLTLAWSQRFGVLPTQLAAR